MADSVTASDDGAKADVSSAAPNGSEASKDERTSARTPPKKKKSWWAKAWDGAFYVAAALALYALFGPKDSGPEVGTPAAFVTLTDLDGGETTRLEPSANRPLLVKAFASWCGACRRSTWIDELGDVDELKGLDYVAVSVDDSIAAARGARDEWPIAGKVLFDQSGEFSRRYDVSLLPTYVLIDAQGRVQRVTAGMPGPLDLRAWSQAASAE